MPRIGETIANEWHFLGECSCGNFEYHDLVREEAFDETAYDGTPDPSKDNPDSENPPYGDYRNFCPQCYHLIEQWQQTRISRIEAILEDDIGIEPEWEHGEHDPRKQALQTVHSVGSLKAEVSTILPLIAIPVMRVG